MKIVSFGEILLRLAAPGYTKLFQKDSLDTTFCGGEANVAVSLAILGLKSEFVTKVPDSSVGRAAINSVRYFGVDVSNVIYGNGRLGLYYLEKGASQRSSEIIYDREFSSIALAKREDFNWNRIFNNASWFHWTGINPALSEELVIICEEACRTAKNKGLNISCDLNFRSKLWSSEKAQSIMRPLMKYVDVCICNEEDADKVLGIRTEHTEVGEGKICDEDYVHTAEAISIEYGCRYVATTLRKSYSASRNGWRGMLYIAEEKKAYFSKEYDIQIVDRVGGGDSFAAGLIYSLTKKLSGQECIDFATAASCLKQTIEGDYNRTKVNDVRLLLESGGNGRVQR